MTALAGGRVHALAHPYALDGRITWHRPEARGFAPMNSYVLVQGDAAMLVDTGLTIHARALLGDLRALLAPGTRLSILHTRLGEYNSLCNTPAVVAAFDVGVVYGPHVNAARWTDFLPHDDAGFHPGIDAMEVGVLQGEQVLHVDADQRRAVDVFSPVLRLLPTHWAYDRATGTLFTSDLFSHVARRTSAGPWVVTAETDTTTFEAVRDHMLGTRYWWLADADTAGIARELAATFARHEVERIAPGYGCVLEGRDVVARHLEMVHAVVAGPGRRAA
jgi:hypothetical protein